MFKRLSTALPLLFLMAPFACNDSADGDDMMNEDDDMGDGDGDGDMGDGDGDGDMGDGDGDGDMGDGDGDGDGDMGGASGDGDMGGAAGDGDALEFKVTITNISGENSLSASGVFNTPTDADEPGPLLPGASYEFSFRAHEGALLSFATMFVQSNDWFVAPKGGGLSLFDEDGMPMTGDVSDMLGLYDAGTEVDETPGEGASQPPRQSAPNTGDADPDSSVRMVEGRDVTDYLEAELSYDEEDGFTLTLTNVSAGADVETPFAPGVFAVGSGMDVLFTEGSDDAGEGLEALAEDGAPGDLAGYLESMTGLTTPLAPGLWVVHKGGMPLYEDGVMDAGKGLEALAEDGDPSELAGEFDGDMSGVFNTPDGADEPGPAFPGDSFSFTVMAMVGESLSFATMVGQSNDYFIGLGDGGMSLFDDEGNPQAGTMDAYVWNAGTEVDEPLGFGPNQAPRQSAPNTGADEDGDVMMTELAASKLVRVTIEEME